MKKFLSVFTLLLSMALGALYLYSLLRWTDASTGFATQGSTSLRYFAMLVPVLFALLTGWCVDSKKYFQDFGRKSGLVLLPVSVASEIYGFMTILSVFFGEETPLSSHHMTATLALLGDCAELLRAVLFILFGVWGLMLFFEKYLGTPGSSMLYLGVAGSAAFFVHTVLRFLVQPASLYRIPPAVEILAALAALLFVTSYLRAHYLPGRQGGTRSVCRNGLLAFFFCTCLAFPQAIWQAASGVSSPVTVPLAAALGLTGLWGAAISMGTIWDN